MNSLLAKEIRLLLPAFGMALLLAVAPVWLFSHLAGPQDAIGNLCFYPLCLGTLFMGLFSFGREFGMGTFPLLLGLPLSRARVWWTKIAVLVAAVAIVFGACLLSARIWHSPLHHHWFSEFGGVGALVTAFLVVIASGLWPALLLRQMVASFWFALLVPAMILVLILWNRGTVFTAEIVLSLYAVGGFFWAWRQFGQAQEVAWTGGEVNLPAWGVDRANARARGRTYRPLAALLRKELQLYQIALAGMAGLFVLHLIVIALRKAITDTPGREDSILRAGLIMFAGLWGLMPLITGGLNVADERRLGTLEAHLCLPMSRRLQFTVKLLVMLFMSGFMSAFLLWLAEGIAGHFHVEGWFGPVKLSLNGSELVVLSLIFIGYSLLIFYASTLTRSILQAIITSVVLVFAFFFFWGITWNIRSFTHIWFWDGPLWVIIMLPAMIITVLWLAYANFRRLSETRRLWLRNARGLAGAMLFAATFTTLLFHRAWEYLTPLEPPHGPARLSLSQPPKFRAENFALTMLLPDGRLWWEPIAPDPGLEWSPFGDNMPSVWRGATWVGTKGNHFLEGSNWVQAAVTYGQKAAIRSDGTLWVSENVISSFNWPTNGRPVPQPFSAKMIEFGKDTNWKSVIRAGDYNLLLLKTDGTLWLWGTNHTGLGPELAHQQPRQVGTDSDWSEFVSASPGMFGWNYGVSGALVWKNDGQAWFFSSSMPRPADPKTPFIYDLTQGLERWPSLDKTRWRSLAGNWLFQFGVRDDGTLWSFDPSMNSAKTPSQKTPAQIGTDRDWISVAGNGEAMIALKADGTVWEWRLQFWRNAEVQPLSISPARLGAHNDWVAIGGSNCGPWLLSADGSVWYWYVGDSAGWLATSRKPVKFANLFSQE